MALTNCDGDPKIYTDGATFDLLITDGQPVMDTGLQNAVDLSLWAPTAWWGNAISTGNEKLYSRMAELERTTLTNKTRQASEEYAKQALSWLVADGIAKSVTASATIPAPNVLNLSVAIEQPEKTVTIRYQINWQTFAVRVGAI